MQEASVLIERWIEEGGTDLVPCNLHMRVRKLHDIHFKEGGIWNNDPPTPTRGLSDLSQKHVTGDWSGALELCPLLLALLWERL